MQGNKILPGLNDEQSKAVTTLDGPVLIVAGAGTGKTRVITYRIAHLVNSLPEISTSNILALTFSRKAADEMLTRVEELIGEHMDELWISTFHGFCHRILRDHCLEANLPNEFRLLDRVEQWIFLRTILPELKLKHYLNLASPQDVVHAFLQFISRAKSELVTPGEYREHINRCADKEERPRLEEVANVYEKYEQRMRKEGYLDFGDLITTAIRLFRDRPKILNSYQQKFKYILVDEFQDTNIAQIELICLLAQGHKNICAVGDDDQGIYRFRGASYASFIKFEEKFPGLKHLRLTQNYRSTKRILSVAERLIKNNGEDRFDPEKVLWTDRGPGETVEILKTKGYEFEAKAVVDRIKELLSSMPEEERSCSRIAVLYRAHAHKAELTKLLKQEGIPFIVAGKLGLFDAEEIKDLISFLKIIIDPYDSVSLFRVLSLPQFKIELSELVKAARFAKRNEKGLFEALQDPSAELKSETTKNCAAFKQILDSLTAYSFKKDVVTLFGELLRKTNLLKDILRQPSTENEAKLRNVGRLYSFLNTYCSEHRHKDLASFLKYMESYIEAGGDFEEGTELGEEGVRLLTVHQAKGLEFDHVFVLSLSQNRFPTRKRPEQIPFPVELMKERLPSGDFHFQEERRLCYVALTRAKENLILSTVDKSRTRQSIFLNEILADSAKYGDISKSELKYGQDAQLLKLLEPSGQASRIQLRAPVKDLLPKSFSFSQIEAYQECPLKYKLRYVYNIPTKASPPLVFGSTVHEVLEEFFKRIKEGERPTADELCQIFLRHFRPRAFEDELQRREYKKEGLRILKQFYRSNKDELKPPLYVEEEFLLKLDEYKIKGVIDRIDSLPEGGVEVIDYKTGAPKSEDFADKNLQLGIYALACRKLLKLEPEKLSFYNLSSNEKVSTYRSDEDLTKTKEEVLAIIETIEKESFGPNVGFHCKWCDYRMLCPAV